MNTSSIENTLAGLPGKLHNYDILLLPSLKGEPLRFAPGNYVGNHRFQVLLSIFRQRYLQAALFGHKDECKNIAEEVLQTVCDKCEPNGRFFQKGRDDRWCQQLSRNSLSTLVMNALKNDPEENNSFERSPKRVCRRPPGFELKQKVVSKNLPATEGYITSPKPFDVVCEADVLGRLSLAHECQNTGNNRLKIIFDMHKKSYETSDQEGRCRIAEEIVSSIIDGASSHFLEKDKSSDMYKPILRKSACACVKKALDSATEGEKRQFGQAEVKKMVQRKYKKAILDRVENRKRVSFFSACLPPTSFNTFRGFTSMAA